MISRRKILELSLIGGGCFAAQACSSPFTPQRAKAIELKQDRFPQGVASADPQTNGIVLWTRVQPKIAEVSKIRITVEVSLSKDFTKVIIQQPLTAEISNDYSIRFFASGLKPDTEYYYRFYTDAYEGARVGRTKTAPKAADNRDVNFAWVSCQDYEAGFYNGWKKLLSDDENANPTTQLDFIVHVGDFIYETIHAQFNDIDTKEVWAGENYLSHRDGSLRKLPDLPSGGTTGKFGGRAAVDVEDFRHLYKEYLKEPYLQEARARWPFICIWDDHEFADNAWQSYMGSKPNQKGRLAANQAWYEYIPAFLSADTTSPEKLVTPNFDRISVENTPFGLDAELSAEAEVSNQKVISSLKVYRQILYGANLNLTITDNRLYRSDHPIPEAWVKEYFSDTKLYKTQELLKALDDANRPETISHNGLNVPNPRLVGPPATILGIEQKKWFKEALSASDATWNVWVNSVPLTPIKYRQDKSLENDQAITIHSDDAWDGYPTEKRELMKFIHDNKISNVISLSGDYHAHLAASDDDALNLVIPEFSVTALSSVSLYRIMRLITPRESQLRDGIIGIGSTGLNKLDEYILNDKTLNPAINFADTNSTGYGLVTVTKSEMLVKLVSLDKPLIDHPKSQVPIKSIAEFHIPTGSNKVSEPALSK